MKNLLSKRFITITVATLLGLTLLSAKSIAGESHCQYAAFKHAKFQEHQGMDSDRMLFMLDKKLDLTKEQRTEIGKVIDQYRPQLRDLKFKKSDGRVKGKELLKNDVFDEEAVQQHAKSQSDLISKMIVLRFRMKHEAHSLLTSDQKQKLSNMFEKFHSRSH
jgi:Spy/CpxP family protein refolding chaperone